MDTPSNKLDKPFNELRLMSGTPISGTIRCSQQAFSKARSGIIHSILKECFEHTLAISHMENIKNKARTNLLYTIFVFDRGYASKNLISYIEDTIHSIYLF